MSTDPTPDDPRETGITGQPPEAEPLPVELADDAAPVRRRRRPIAPPHPGFAWAIGWCVLLLVVANAVAIVLLLGMVFVQIIRLGSVDAGMAWLMGNQTNPALLVPAQMAAHITIFLTALLALRLVVGRSWPYQVALRRPAISHVLLVLVGAPAFWLLSGGLQYVASLVLPSIYELPSLLVVGMLLLLIVGVCWLVARGVTGKDWVPELARSPLHVQLAVGPFGLVLLLAVGVLLFRLVSPYIFRIPHLTNDDLLDKSIEGLLAVPWWAALLVIAVTPAFSEEFLCRAFLGRGLVGRHGFVMGIIWTSFFFGAIHVFPQQAAMAALMGLVLHSAYVASRSLLISMLWHFLNNSYAVLSYKFSGQLGPRLQAVESHPEQIPPICFEAAAVLGAAVLWAFYTSRARLVRSDGSNEPPWQPPFPGVMLPPPNSGTEVVSPWPGLLPTLAVIVAAAGFGCALYWA